MRSKPSAQRCSIAQQAWLDSARTCSLAHDEGVQIRHAISNLHQLQRLAVLSIGNVQVGDVRAGFRDLLEGTGTHLEP
jgi:hypothetical protein